MVLFQHFGLESAPIFKHFDISDLNYPIHLHRAFKIYMFAKAKFKSKSTTAPITLIPINLSLFFPISSTDSTCHQIPQQQLFCFHQKLLAHSVNNIRIILQTTQSFSIMFRHNLSIWTIFLGSRVFYTGFAIRWWNRPN